MVPGMQDLVHLAGTAGITEHDLCALANQRQETLDNFAWPAIAPTPSSKVYFEHKEDEPFLVLPTSTRSHLLFPSRCPSPDPLSLLDLDQHDDEDQVSNRITTT